MNHLMYQTENKSFFVYAGWMKIFILTTDAETMANVIKDIILRLGLDKAKIAWPILWWLQHNDWEEEGSSDPY